MQLCENLRDKDDFLNYQNQFRKKWKFLIDQLPWKRLEGDGRATWKGREPDRLTAEFYLISKELVISVLFKLFGVIEKDRNFLIYSVHLEKL